jgi:hypothetical protein
LSFYLSLSFCLSPSRCSCLSFSVSLSISLCLSPPGCFSHYVSLCVSLYLSLTCRSLHLAFIGLDYWIH